MHRYIKQQRVVATVEDAELIKRYNGSYWPMWLIRYFYGRALDYEAFLAKIMKPVIFDEEVVRDDPRDDYRPPRAVRTRIVRRPSPSVPRVDRALDHKPLENTGLETSWFTDYLHLDISPKSRRPETGRLTITPAASALAS